MKNKNKYEKSLDLNVNDLMTALSNQADASSWTAAGLNPSIGGSIKKMKCKTKEWMLPWKRKTNSFFQDHVENSIKTGISL